MKQIGVTSIARLQPAPLRRWFYGTFLRLACLARAFLREAFVSADGVVSSPLWSEVNGCIAWLVARAKDLALL